MATLGKFRVKKLQEEGKYSAIPLVLQGKYQWNKDTGRLTKSDAVEGEDTARLQLVPEARDLLNTIGDKPIAVLAICGPYRSGKSYFLSHVVGQQGTFEVAHSTQVCTRGIWLSTTALECDEFVLLLLDTEGTGGLEGKGQESFTTKLLVTTILLSSFLIYNSMDVPKQTDLQQMSSFAHLSTVIESNPKEFQKHFPHFMWLLRDVSNIEYDENGKVKPLIHYLNEEVLRPTGQKDSDNVINAICTLFPQPLLCEWLPPPDGDPSALENGADNTSADENGADDTNESFLKCLHKVIDVTKGSIHPKVGFYEGEMITVTGPILANLATSYIDDINEKDSVHSLEDSWKAVIKLKLEEEAESLVVSYEKEMNEKLRGEDGELMGRLPMEESSQEVDSVKPTLMSLHEAVFQEKYKSLMDKVHCLLPKWSQSDAMPGPTDVRSVIEKFEQKIVVKEKEYGKEKVKSGILHKFTTANFEKSRSKCERLYNTLKKKYGIDENYARLLQQRIYNEKLFCDGKTSIEKVREDYNAEAVGPARESVRSKMDESLQPLEDMLGSVPGPPVKLAIVGKGRDSIKLQWAEPIINPRAAKKYIVEYRQGKRAWVKDAETTELWHIVKNLDSSTKYEFRVLSWNDEAYKEKRDVEEILKVANLEDIESLQTRTKLGKITSAILIATGFVAAAPLIVTVGLPGIVAIPFFATLGAPIAGGVVAVHKVSGDWTEEVQPKNTSAEELQSACGSE